MALVSESNPVLNRTRRHSTLGYQSPMQFLEEWRLAQHEKNLAA